MRKALPIRPEYTDRSIATTAEIEQLIAINSPVGIGVSGGKDSCAVAIKTIAHLDAIGHKGPRVLIHADLGVTEWQDSLPTCERLAKHLNTELMIVRRSQGDMMDRWEQRWSDNVSRWLSLSCVKLILPWSTPAMRFCTAELKVDQITRALFKRFPNTHILNVTGIRRAESSERAKAPIAKAEPKLTSITHKTIGTTWNPIIEWSTPDVFAYAKENNFRMHEAYTVYGASRVSCIWCMLATEKDHQTSMRPKEHIPLGRRMVRLEAASTFAFQCNRWLGDTICDILSPEQINAIAQAKERAAKREQAEARIPEHLLYVKGWPTCVPTQAEASLLASVRSEVAEAVGLKDTFVDPDQIIARYRFLIEEKARKKKTQPLE